MFAQARFIPDFFSSRRRTMQRAMWLVVVASLVAVNVSNGQAGKSDQDMLQGNWQVVSVKNPGGGDPPPEVVKTMMGQIKGDVFRLTAMDKPMAVFKYKLGTANKMKTIDLTHEEGPGKGSTEMGIYKIEGDTLTMCWNLAAGKERPAAFAVKDGATYSLVVFKKTK
jgi:uncharacterized protein (TIGR03067 family)